MGMALKRRREKDWRKALDAESFAATVEEAIDLTSNVSGGRHTTGISAKIADPAVDTTATDPSEFRADLRDAGSAEIEQADGWVHTTAEARAHLDIHVIVRGARGSSLPTTALVVLGEDRTWVEGIFAQLVEVIDRTFEAQERKEAEEVVRERRRLRSARGRPRNRRTNRRDERKSKASYTAPYGRTTGSTGRRSVPLPAWLAPSPP